MRHTQHHAFLMMYGRSTNDYGAVTLVTVETYGGPREAKAVKTVQQDKIVIIPIPNDLSGLRAEMSCVALMSNFICGDRPTNPNG